MKASSRNERRDTRLLTNLGALALGVMLSGGGAVALNHIQQRDVDEAGLADEDSSRDAGDRTSSQHSTGRSTQVQSGASQEFRLAWDDISHRRISKRDRLTLETELLKRWARVDLEGALHATLGEEWDDPLFIGGDKRFPLASAFSDIFRDQPREAWRILQSGRLGVGGRLFQEAMLMQVAQSNPKLTLSLLPEMAPEQRGRVLQQAFSSLQPADREAALKTLSANAGSDDERADLLAQVMRVSPPSQDAATLRDQLTQLAAGPERDTALAGWAAKVQQNPASFPEEMDKIPEEMRAAAAKAALAGQNDRYSQSPNLLPALNELIAAGDWEYLEKSGAEKFGLYASYNQAPQVAAWAMDLPARPELSEIYQKATSAIARQDPSAFLAQLDQLPSDDWHRQQGLVAVANAAQMQGDSALAESTIASITDPAARQAALRNRYNYQIQSNIPVTRSDP